MRTKATSEVVLHLFHLEEPHKYLGFSEGDFTFPECQIVQSIFSDALCVSLDHPLSVTQRQPDTHTHTHTSSWLIESLLYYFLPVNLIQVDYPEYSLPLATLGNKERNISSGDGRNSVMVFPSLCSFLSPWIT